MVYSVYILWSEKLHKYYIGQTNNLERRLLEHQDGKGWTKLGRPWHTVHVEQFQTRADAMNVERYLKSLRDRVLIEKYIAGWRSSTSGGS